MVTHAPEADFENTLKLHQAGSTPSGSLCVSATKLFFLLDGDGHRGTLRVLTESSAAAGRATGLVLAEVAGKNVALPGLCCEAPPS